MVLFKYVEFEPYFDNYSHQCCVLSEEMKREISGITYYHWWPGTHRDTATNTATDTA